MVVTPVRPYMKEIAADKVAIYIRWSTEDQGEGTTLAVQTEACRSYVLSQGWALSEDLVFVDDGISGATMDRPALTHLRAMVHAGGVDCVVVYKLDRLSRSVVDVVKLVLDEWEGLCYIKSARENIDTTSQTGKMFFYQLMSFAEWERSVIKERTFSGKLRRAQEGRNPGIPSAYGYKLDEQGNLHIVPEQAAVVQLMFNLYLSGMGCSRIGRHLEQKGHLSPCGGRWSSSQLSRMLGNPIYAGTLVYGRRVTVRGKRVRSDKPHLVKEGVAPVIIEPETFRAVQAVKATRPGLGRHNGSGRTLSSRSLLTGLLKCTCGYSCCAQDQRGIRCNYRYYYCAAPSNRGKDFCDSGRIRQDALDYVVSSALIRRFGDNLAKDKLLREVTAGLDLDVREARAAQDALQAQVQKVSSKEAKLKALLLQGELDIQEYRELKADLNRQLAGLKAQLCEAGGRRVTAEKALSERYTLADRLSQIDRWQSLKHQERKQLLGQFIAQLVIYRHKTTGNIACAITWRWSSEGHATSVQTQR